MKPKDWLAFCALGLIWGSSFLWIKIAVAEVPPFTLVAFRVTFGAIGMLTLCKIAGVRLYFKRAFLPYAIIMGLLNAAVPYTLISWGEMSIPSAEAAILNGTVPLFTILCSHFLLNDERMTPLKVIGLITGFIGMFLLVAKKPQDAVLGTSLLGELAVVLASIFYAYTTVYAKRHPLKGVPSLLKATWLLCSAALFQWLFALIAEHPLHLPQKSLTWIALLWLGLLGSCLAYRLYLFLIQSIGSTRTSLVTYIMPIVGLLLGFLFLNEAITTQMILGMALVIGGIMTVNLKFLQKKSVFPIDPTP